VRIAFCVSEEDLGEGLRRMVRFASRVKEKAGFERYR